MNKKTLLYLGLVVLLAILPFVSNTYILTILIFANIYAITAASWDLLAGYAGQMSFGQVAFYGTGAYGVGLLINYFGLPCIGRQGWGYQESISRCIPLLSNPISALAIGSIAAIVLSLLIGFAAVRLRGPYLSIVTFAICIVLQRLVVIYGKYTGGQFGLTVGALLPSITYTYYMSLFFMIASIMVMLLIVNSRYGLYFKAIRDDEMAAQAIGINPIKYKLLAFALSSFFCSIAGGLYAFSFGMVDWGVYGYSFNLMWIEMSVIGGYGTIVGSVIGAYFVRIIVELLRISQALSNLAFAVIFLLVIKFFPQGLLSLFKRSILWRKLS